ncbi:MAG: hypothetical protein IPK60_10330 [Sandaracinaceae bacterium]|nr:hypothetical protein [Sandaracinaceae bacterium]
MLSRTCGYQSLAIALFVSACVETPPNSERSTSALGSSDVDASTDIDASTYDASPASGLSGERGESEPSAQEPTPEQYRARELLDQRLEEIERTTGRALPEAWASADADQLHDVAALVRGATPTSARDAWLIPLRNAIAADRTLGGVTPAQDQLDALVSLSEQSVGAFSAEWDFVNGSPARLEQLGYVVRDVDAAQAWNAFLSAKHAEIQALFGSSIFSDLEQVAVEQVGEFDVVRLLRRHGAYRIDQDYLDVYVSSERSILGAGVVWRVTARWNPLVPAAMTRLLARGLISEERARASAGGDALSAFLLVACAQECSATWHVLVSPEESVRIDALSGDVTNRTDPQLRGSGTLYQHGYPPGSTAAGATIRLRGARIRDSSGVEIGATNGDGMYTATGAGPWTIELNGRQSTSGGMWPNGRVDRRANDSSWPAIISSSVSWNQASDPNRNFGSPDAWSSQPSTMRKAGSVVFNWYAYWQNLFKYYVGVEVTDTVSIVIRPDVTSGLHGGGTQTSNTTPPGSGQVTWATTQVYWNPTDVISSSPDSLITDMLSIFAHEYAHTVQACAEQVGYGCSHMDAADDGLRPSDPSTWRYSVFASFQENFPSFFATVLSEYRTWQNGGSFKFEPYWKYHTYFDPTDDFANPLEDNDPGTPAAEGMINCLSTPCGSPLFDAVAPSFLSPYTQRVDMDPTSSCTCLRRCTVDADCAITGNCGGGGQCEPNNYRQQWFSNVGERLAFDIGWLPAFRAMAVAATGAQNNGMRNYNLGTDTWYARLADQGLNVAAITRAVRSVTDEAGIVSRDDFADARAEALPIPLVNSSGTSLAWGSGPLQYPQLDSLLDSDYFLFRGVANSSYIVTADPRPGSSVDLAATVYRVSDGWQVGTSSAPTGQSVVFTTIALPANGWYVLKIHNRVLTTGPYTARISLAPSSDDFPNVTDEAYPLPSGVTQSGYLSALDVDRFQIYVPSTSGSLQVVSSSSTAATVKVYGPTGTLLGSASGSLTIPASTIATAGIGYYLVDVVDGSSVPRSYSVTATLSCATSLMSSCDDRTSSAALPTRKTWGDRFAGRLPTAASEATYSILLNANESVSAGLFSDSPSCRFEVELLPPAAMAHFDGGPVFIWTDDNTSGIGTGAADTAGSRRGAGGHFYAPLAGTYRLRVSQTSAATCAYRLVVSKPGLTTTAMPTW